jgi:phytoene synthase
MSSLPPRPSVTADAPLSADIVLALSYAPGGKRTALRALFVIDSAMADVLRSTTEPQLGAIRLAWWREALERLDQAPAPAEPRLQAVATEILPLGLNGGDLAGLERGWVRLLDPFPWDSRTAEAIWFRGRLLYALGARIVGQTNDQISEAGGLWALVDAARHCSDAESRAMLLAQARTFAHGLERARFPSRLRSLSMLTALAARDALRGEPFEREASPARMAAMLRHRLTGRLPRS